MKTISRATLAAIIGVAGAVLAIRFDDILSDLSVRRVADAEYPLFGRDAQIASMQRKPVDPSIFCWADVRPFLLMKQGGQEGEFRTSYTGLTFVLEKLGHYKHPFDCAGCKCCPRTGEAAHNFIG